MRFTTPSATVPQEHPHADRHGGVVLGLAEALAVAQGPQAYAEQMLLDHPELDAATLRADAVLAVERFHGVVCAN